MTRGSGPGAPRWLVLSIPAPPREEGFLVVDALGRLGARKVERDGELIVAHVPPPEDLEAFLADVRAALRASTRNVDPDPAWRWEAAEPAEEAWRRELPVRRISERLAVAPAGAPLGDPRPAVVVELTPAGAFGTAEHPTTRSCLRLLEEALTGGERIADVGTGSGILAVAAALLGARSCLALEADRHSVAAARENARRNGVEDRVEVVHRTVAPADLEPLGPFDGILANLGPELLADLLPGMARALAPRGWAILSGVPAADRNVVLACARRAGLEPAVEDVEGGWWTARLS